MNGWFNGDEWGSVNDWDNINDWGEGEGYYIVILVLEVKGVCCVED